MPKKSAKLHDLVTKLSKDPKIKAAMNEFNTRAKTKLDEHQHLKDFFKTIMKFLGRKSTKQAEDIIEVIFFLASFSIFLKKSVFDRPEVQEFFKQSWGGMQKFYRTAIKAAEKFVEGAIKGFNQKKSEVRIKPIKSVTKPGKKRVKKLMPA